jgi:hypothetical protein
MFLKLNPFLASGERNETPSLLGPLERVQSFRLSPLANCTDRATSLVGKISANFRG